MTITRVYERPGIKVEVTRNKGQSEESLDADLARSLTLLQELLDDGVVSYQGRYRWVGPLKIKRIKEVGPPPWRFPHAGINRWSDHSRIGFSAYVGWRSTAYRLYVLWAGFRIQT